ncbi:MAG: EAL domain-containing protein [Gammaproteobacteria bacterium]|nr:EAL domain-containing protein [Gammaproteobacteria bacterium]
MREGSRFHNIAFTHAFQAIVDTSESKVSSYEALIRGSNNESAGHVFSQVRPDDMVWFDQVSREKALLTAARLGIDCAINLNFFPSSVLFNNGTLLERTVQTAMDLGIGAERLVVELTEAELVRDTEPLRAILNNFRRKKVVIAIDDFGAGYSGLNMLAEIHPDIIKIDMALVRDIHKRGARQSIVHAIHSVCLDLGIRVIAEGVETVAEFDFLRSIGISLFQGHLFGKPSFESLSAVHFPTFPAT